MKLKNAKAVIVAILGVATAATVSFNAFARPAYGYEITYYADAAMTEYVGSRELTCNGRSVSYGTVTPYYDMMTYPCR